MKQKTAMQQLLDRFKEYESGTEFVQWLITDGNFIEIEREQIEEAFNAGLKTKTGIQTDDFKWGGKYYQQKYGDEPTIKND